MKKYALMVNMSASITAEDEEGAEKKFDEYLDGAIKMISESKDDDMEYEIVECEESD